MLVALNTWHDMVSGIFFFTGGPDGSRHPGFGNLEKGLIIEGFRNLEGSLNFGRNLLSMIFENWNFGNLGGIGKVLSEISCGPRNSKMCDWRRAMTWTGITLVSMFKSENPRNIPTIMIVLGS